MPDQPQSIQDTIVLSGKGDELEIRCTEAGEPVIGVRFEEPGGDDNCISDSFVPLHDLGRNGDIGFFRPSQFPGQPNKCTYDNPFQIRPQAKKNYATGLPAYAWIDAQNKAHKIGTLMDAANLYAALREFLLSLDTGKPIPHSNNPGWGDRIPWRVQDDSIHPQMRVWVHKKTGNHYLVLWHAEILDAAGPIATMQEVIDLWANGLTPDYRPEIVDMLNSHEDEYEELDWH